MAATKRYIPPGARNRDTAGTKNTDQDLPRTLEDLVQDGGSKVFTVKLRSEQTYSNLPFPELTEKAESGFQFFEFPFHYRELRKLMLWFREIGWKDQDAVLQFPPALEKPHRKQVHEIAQSFGLGTSSAGFKDDRFISVYSVERATLGVGKNYLTKQEREKANDIWRLINIRGEKEKFSHNEIDEMVLANKLPASLQELWEKENSLSVDDFAEKCKVEDE